MYVQKKNIPDYGIEHAQSPQVRHRHPCMFSTLNPCTVWLGAKGSWHFFCVEEVNQPTGWKYGPEGVRDAMTEEIKHC